MKQVLRQLGEDFLSAILFLALYTLTSSLTLGVGVAVAVGIAQLARRRIARRPIEPMQWMSLLLVVGIGSAALLFHSPRFIMIKPSVIHLSLAAIMLRRGWLTRYLPPIAQKHLGQPLIDATGYAWAALLAGIAVANLIVAAECSVATWAWFISFGAFGAKAAAFGVQYAVFRALIVHRVAAARLAPAGATP